MRSLFVGVSAAALLLAAGCGAPKPSLNGTWVASGLKDMPGATIETTFTEPSTVKMLITGEQMGLKFAATVDGDYTLEGESLTMHFKKADVKFEGLTPDQEKAMAAGKEQANEAFLNGMGKETKNTLKWIDNNTIELKENTQTVTMKRK